MDRPAWKIDNNNPGTDLACETAAALASASILFKDVDSAYSEELLTHARQLFEFGDQYRGVYSDSITGAADFYRYLLKFIKIIDPGMCQRGRQGGVQIRRRRLTSRPSRFLDFGSCLSKEYENHKCGIFN